jgi:hypothetical protein
MSPATRAAVALPAGLLAGAGMGALLTGQPWLTRALPGGLPLGNALAAAVLLAPALIAGLLAPPRARLHRASVAALLLAALWLPLSIALAGNLALDFAAGRGTAWLVLTLACAGSGLLVLAWAVLAQAWRCVRPHARSTVEGPP